MVLSSPTAATVTTMQEAIRIGFEGACKAAARSSEKLVEEALATLPAAMEEAPSLLGIETA